MAETLENKIESKESKTFIKKAAKLGFKAGMAAATTALSVPFVGSTGVIVGGALALGDLIGNIIKKKPVYDTISEALTVYSAVNTVIAPIVVLGDATFPLISNETFLGKAARTLYATTVYNAAFVASYRGAEHLIDNNLNPVGITKTISDNFHNRWKRVGLGFLPGYAFVANQAPNFMGIPHFAWNAVPWGIYNQIMPLPEPKKHEHSGYAPSYATSPAH